VRKRIRTAAVHSMQLPAAEQLQASGTKATSWRSEIERARRGLVLLVLVEFVS